MGALTATTPKPLLPLAGRPVLDHLLEPVLEFEGLAAIHVVSNHHYAAAFNTWADGWRSRLGPDGPTLEIHDDGSTSAEDRLGAIGDLGFVLGRLERESPGAELPAGALVAAGDNLYRFPLAPLWQRFRERQTSQVLALREDDPEKLRRTGVLELEGERVVRLHEKPDTPPSSWACPSLYAFDQRALARVSTYLNEGHPRDEIGHFVADLVRRQPVEAVFAEGERLHVGSPESYREAETVLGRTAQPPASPSQRSPETM